MKEPKCSYCKQLGHYKIKCFLAPRKAIKSSSISSYKRVLATPKIKSISELYQRQTALKTPVSQRKILIKELDAVFSKYIRLKKSVNGVAQCVTCGKKDHWKNMDCGHFIPRGHIGTRFDEKNCHVQCRNCNRTLSGNMASYKYYMEVWFGDDIVDILRRDARKSIKTYEIQEMITIYKEKLLTFI